MADARKNLQPRAGNETRGDLPVCRRRRDRIDVVAVPGQNITAGDFDELTEALASKTAYANVHTVNFPEAKSAGKSARQRKDHDHGNGNHD